MDQLDKLLNELATVRRELVEKVAKSTKSEVDKHGKLKLANSKNGVELTLSIILSEGDFETALAIDGKLIYETALGYENMKRFETLDELIEDVNNLKNIIPETNVCFTNKN